MVLRPCMYLLHDLTMLRPCTYIDALAKIMWTEECERALEEYENGAEDSVKTFLEVCCARLEGLIKLVQGQ